MGLGSEIYQNTRDRRFLFEWTFRFEPELDDMMHQSIEMGRAFIIRE
jgi:hypothetical protein